MPKELSKIYDPKQVEEKTYQFWLDGNYFHAKANPDKKPYTIVMPPPNITGQLHLGHAMDCTLQDTLIRFRRMQGFETLWLPGTDHASIATEAKIVNEMKTEGLSKEDLGRDAFLERAWEWKKKYGGRIVEQQKKLGASCDWERERFTLDEGCSKAVNEVFVKLYEKGLIYQGKRMINWCPHCLTSISDAEVEYEEQAGHFWHLRYPLADGSGDVLLATTRPETMLGDTAVAVNPNDERYRHLVGKMVKLPLCNREIPIVADDYVDIEFGTGVVKITPAHDPNDYEVGLRHELPILKVIDEDARMSASCGSYAGLERYAARKAIVADLDAQGFLVKVEEHTHNVGTCYRCSTTVEPMLSRQWFVKMDTLAAPAIEAVKQGQVKLIPERFDKTYYHWMENIKDWCISRQLWWGHRIPAYTCGDCGALTVSRERVTVCPKCGASHMQQDEDTLDTWFSSALWPFSTLGWPDQTEELAYFYPTNTLVTGYDIIFFWVARMIFSGLEHTGKVPFDTVLFHGLIRDAQGRKMSKSLGNGIDPLEVVEQYGADALRFTLASGNTPGNDMRFSDDKVLSSRNFANKLWNASRFVLMNIKDEKMCLELPETLTIEDRWVLSKYNKLVKEVSENLERFELGIAVSKLYDFIWDVLCDWYLELVKSRLWEDGEAAVPARQVLVYLMSNTLKLLHPFMPFITEEIWQALPHEGESIMISSWPVFEQGLAFEEEEAEFEKVIEAIKAIRVRRSEMNVPPSKKASLFIQTSHEEIFSQGIPFLQRLAWADQVRLQEAPEAQSCVQVNTDSARILIPLAQLVDREKEIARLQKEKASCEKDIAIISGKLDNAGFVAKAPEKVIQAEREKQAKAIELLSKIQTSLAAYQQA